MHLVTQRVTQQLACSLQALMAIQKQVEQTLHSLHSGHLEVWRLFKWFLSFPDGKKSEESYRIYLNSDTMFSNWN